MIKGETFMKRIEDVKLKYNRSLLGKPSMNAILNSLIDYCSECIDAARGDKIGMIFLNFAFIEQIKEYLEGCLKEWKVYKAKSSNIVKRGFKEINQYLKRDKNHKESKKEKLNNELKDVLNKRSDRKERENLNNKLMKGENIGEGRGNNPVNITTMFQAPGKIWLLVIAMNKYKGNNDGKNFDRACEELSRGKEQYKKYIKEIFDSDNTFEKSRKLC